MAHQFIQVPPDSTGKKVYNRVELVISYDNGTIDFQEGDLATFETSEVTGNIVHVEEGSTTVAGELHIVLHAQSPTVVIDGENIQVESVTYATANGVGTLYYHQANFLTGANDTANAAYVDNRGQIYTRYADGVPEFSVGGKQKVSTEIIMYAFTPIGAKNTTTISDETSGGASATLNNTIPAEVLSCTTSAGDHIKRTTDQYNKYVTGSTSSLNLVIQVGDTGKANVIRRWGIYDDENGFFFELNGTTLYVVKRSKSTGTVVDTKIAQTDWNKDKADGSGGQENLSGYDIDVSKTNLYAINFRGTVEVQFAVYNGDEKITLHKVTHVGNDIGKMCSSLNLPLRWEQLNSGTAASTSEMYLMGATLTADATVFQFTRTTTGYLLESVAVSANVWKPVMSIRPGQFRTWLFPHQVSVYSTIPLMGRIRSSSNAALIGSTWAITQSKAQIDTAASVLVAGSDFGSNFVAANVISEQVIVDTNEIDPFASKLIRRADITEDPFHMTLELKGMPGSGTGIAHISFLWIEV